MSNWQDVMIDQFGTEWATKDYANTDVFRIAVMYSELEKQLGYADKEAIRRGERCNELIEQVQKMRNCENCAHTDGVNGEFPICGDCSLELNNWEMKE